MSVLLGVTGNNEDFIPYLEENGAFMEGNYEYETMASEDHGNLDEEADLMRGHAGPGVALRRQAGKGPDEAGKPAEKPSLGEKEGYI